MKSTTQQLQNRGHLETYKPELVSSEKAVKLLQSAISIERSKGARMARMVNTPSLLPSIIKALNKEKKLYTKMELCETLVHFGQASVPLAVPLLGKVGQNQIKGIPNSVFNKISYPLRRDIIARTLSKIGEPALPALYNTLQSTQHSAIYEALDAIGYIVFYSKILTEKHKEMGLKKLILLFKKEGYEPVMRWKIIRTLESFPKAKSFLENLMKNECNLYIKLEINRSIQQIERKSKKPALT